MTKKWLAALIAAIMLLSAGASAEARLTVQGNGTVLMDADRATIRVGVREIAEDVVTAQSNVNGRIEAIVNALKALGLDEKDIFTDSIGIYPNYDYSGNRERITGYNAYNTVSATISDIEGVGKYIDAAFEAGANTLDNVAFSASDTQDASNQALAEALKNATAKAQALAEASGMTLGEIVSIAENAGYSYGGTPVLYAKAEAADAMENGTRVMASQLQVGASVIVEFELRKGE